MGWAGLSSDTMVLSSEVDMSCNAVWNKFCNAIRCLPDQSLKLIPASAEQFGGNLLEKWIKQYKLIKVRQVAIYISSKQ